MFGATDGGNQVRTATFGYQKQRMVNGVELHPDLQPEFKGRQIDWHIGDHLRSDIRQFTSVPCFHLLSASAQGFSHSVNANRDAWNGYYRMDKRRGFNVTY